MTTPSNSQSLIYLVRAPKVKTEKTPVIILLHGVGSNEKDLFSLADHLPDKFLVISARAPIELGPGSYAWFHVDFSSGKPLFNEEEEVKSRKLVLEFIEEMQKKYSFDYKQLYIGGFSQGAIMSYSIGLTHPDKARGIVIMSGRLLNEVRPLFAKTEQLKSLRIFISHGTRDTVLNIEYARESVSYLKNIGLTPTYKEYNEGHGVNNEMLSDLVKWLEKD